MGDDELLSAPPRWYVLRLETTEGTGGWGTDPRRQRPHGPDGRDGLADMRTIEAIYDAARTGDRVEVSPRE